MKGLLTRGEVLSELDTYARLLPPDRPRAICAVVGERRHLIPLDMARTIVQESHLRTWKPGWDGHDLEVFTLEAIYHLPLPLPASARKAIES